MPRDNKKSPPFSSKEAYNSKGPQNTGNFLNLKTLQLF